MHYVIFDDVYIDEDKNSFFILEKNLVCEKIKKNRPIVGDKPTMSR